MRGAFRIRLQPSALAVLAAGLVALPAAAGTLDKVKQRGTLECGVSEGLRGFSEKDAQGRWAGFDVDFCRAVAAAVLGDAGKVNFTPLSAGERFEALKQGKVDLLSRNSTWTLGREAGLGLAFAGITYHDGQGFLVARSLGVDGALSLDKAKVCVEAGTTTQLNLGDFFRANSMSFEEKAFPSAAEALAAFQSGQCNVLTRDQSALYAERLKLPKPGDAVILPDVISKEPLGPVTRSDDFPWFNIVKWVNFALVNAEELGVSAANADEAVASTKPDVRRLTGAEGGFGKSLGLDEAWAIRAVKATGNYSEIYERNLGVNSPLGIPRGLNQLWNMGGVLYAPPMR
ncbi:amino acid ABC transporter substrate-binding protein [Bosea sp. (in: a-proteobacteria)]|jgi:general L-amino acid transport system substrate-binding protein|uniref:amino acid ABC transporter substrate-binding protein n=1 Tax=Bosea sp. (in: a-proteobacteria) TaxID=1871050 RepID=UPI000868A1AB|nr:amino acid ABC transporter substrate-binding protein [Bosea sp. (in: a-proteobacteria)]MBN9438415.1 amino acid ABC transporter substrate-binding protein [Bosea sp. (in: a-proteobacteria)]MBN9470278.1 amino acid ABC transporter substrate-binding protein [Bosea sp. (in: a-proteobacteria)]ODT44158.1 MAG: amino acid ABC transporter substrate-bindnig protein [Methylobacterium sp. SCN 67-24]